MTPVETLRALLAKATPGLWKAERTVSDTLDCDAEYVIDATDPNLFGIAHADEDDAALIVAAVNALPALLELAEATMALRIECTRDHLDDEEREDCELCAVVSALAKLGSK